MNRTKGKTYLIFAIVVLVLIVIFRPIPQIQREQALKHKGVVQSIFAADDQDIVFKLEDGMEFHLNRGKEQGLDIDSLSQLYKRKELLFLYPDYWSILAAKQVKHLSQVEFDGKVIYTEFEEED